MDLCLEPTPTTVTTWQGHTGHVTLPAGNTSIQRRRLRYVLLVMPMGHQVNFLGPQKGGRRGFLQKHTTSARVIRGNLTSCNISSQTSRIGRLAWKKMHLLDWMCSQPRVRWLVERGTRCWSCDHFHLGMAIAELWFAFLIDVIQHWCWFLISFNHTCCGLVFFV